MQATTSTLDYRDKMVSVWIFQTTPTDSDEPSWIELRMTRKEAAIREIRMQPFFSLNAKVSGAGTASAGLLGSAAGNSEKG